MTCKSSFGLALLWAALALCATAIAPAQADSPYRVTYDNGVSIEVIAISITPTRNKPFWDPSGAKLLERPYDARQSGTLRGLTPGKQTYELVIRISGVKEKPIYLTPAEGSDFKVLMTFIPYTGGKTADDLRAFLIAAPWDKDLLDLDIAVAANDWQPVRSFNGPGLLGGGQQEVEVYNPDPYQVQRTPGLHYSVRVAAPGEEAMRLVAMDEAGTRHISSGDWMVSDQQGYLKVILPEVAREMVKEYRIEKSPYQIKTLQGIHLRPPGPWSKLVSDHDVNRLNSQELRFDPAKDQARIDDDIDKIARTRAFDDSDTWVGAIRDLVEIGPPAIPSLIAEICQTSRPYARSSLATALRAMDDPRAVAGLAESLATCPFAPNDYGGGTTRDPTLLQFMLDSEDFRQQDERAPTFGLGRPIREINWALVWLSGEHHEGNEHLRKNDRRVYQEVSAKWVGWWQRNKNGKLEGLPLLRTGGKNEWTPLHLAIADGRFQEAQKLIASGADVNAAGYAGWTPLHLACALQQMQIAKLLLDNKANVAAKTDENCTPLHAAVGLGPAPLYVPLPPPDVKLINLLVERGADPKAVNKRGRTALHGAVASGNAAVVELLLDLGVPIAAKDIRGRTALHRAVECNNEPAIDVLLAGGADVNARDVDGRIPLRMAYYNLNYLDYNPPILAKLLAKGSDVDLPTAIVLGTTQDVITAIKRNPAAVNEKAKTDEEEAPLTWAIRRKSPQMLKILLNAGADPNARDKMQNTPLHAAVFAADQKMIAALIEAKADVNGKGQGGIGPIYWACSSLNIEIVNQLIAAGAKPLQGDQINASSPLNAALSAAMQRPLRGQRDPVTPQEKLRKATIIVKALLDAGADPNERNWSFRAPVIFGALPDLADILIARGAKFDVTSDDGNNALHIAAVSGPQENVKYWLDRGLGLESKNKKDETPLHRAAESYLQTGETVKELLERGADVKARDNEGLTPLHHAAAGFNVAAVTMLLEKGADIEAKDNAGATPLHHAARRGYDQMILLFLKRGAIIDSIDSAGKTPLQWAANPQTKKLLIAQGAPERPAK